MRTHAEWNVDTHMRSATGPTRAPTRCFISSAALLVNVMARIENGDASSSPISHATRWVSTRVLPDPAPATTNMGPPGCVTASCCTGLSPARRSAVEVGPGTATQPYRWRTTTSCTCGNPERPVIRTVEPELMPTFPYLGRPRERAAAA